MKTLKKTLCLVLAVVMVVGVLVLPANAAATTTEDTDATAAFKTLNEYGVMYGVDANNTPALNKNINRQDMAAIIYRVMTGDTTDKYVANYAGSANEFADSATFATWAKGYIGYVRNQGIFVGDNNGNFKPTEEIKGNDVLTVLLRCLGYGQNGEFTGPSYAQNALTQATQLHMFGANNIVENKHFYSVKADMSKAINRGTVAKLTYNASINYIATYFNGTYTTYNTSGRPVAPNTPNADRNPQLIEYKDNETSPLYTQFGVQAKKYEPDVIFNAPDIAVKYDLSKYYKYEQPVKEYWTAVTHCQVAQDLGFSSTLDLKVYTNGAQNTGTTTLYATNTQATIGAQGRHTLFFDRDTTDGRPADTIVYIDTLLAEVRDVTPATFDAAGHLKKAASLTLRVFDGPSDVTDHNKTTTNHAADFFTEVTKYNGATNYAYTKGQFLLVNAVHKSDASGLTATASEIASYTDDDYNGSYKDETGKNNCLDQKTNKEFKAGEESVGTGYLVEILGVATSISGAQSKVWYNVDVNKHTITGTDYNDNNRFHLDEAQNDTTGSYTWYFDTKGNLIGAVKNATAYAYGVITSIWWTDGTDGVGYAQAKVTYMDGTTDTLRVGKMTIDTAGVGVAYAKATGTAAQGDVAEAMTVTDDGDFSVNESAAKNAAATQERTNGIIFDNLFQISTDANGVSNFVEVAGVNTHGSSNNAADYKGMSNTTTMVRKGVVDNYVTDLTPTPSSAGDHLKITDSTMFLIRSGSDDSNYKLTPVTGYKNIVDYISGEVDFVDVNGDTYADYVYITAKPTTESGWHIFYAGAKVVSDSTGNKAVMQYTKNSSTTTVYGWLDGVEGSVTIANDTSNPYTSFVKDENGHTLWLVKIVDGKVTDVDGAHASDYKAVNDPDNSGNSAYTADTGVALNNSTDGMSDSEDLGMYKDHSIILLSGNAANKKTTDTVYSIQVGANLKSFTTNDKIVVIGDEDELTNTDATIIIVFKGEVILQMYIINDQKGTKYDEDDGPKTGKLEIDVTGAKATCTKDTATINLTNVKLKGTDDYETAADNVVTADIEMWDGGWKPYGTATGTNVTASSSGAAISTLTAAPALQPGTYQIKLTVTSKDELVKATAVISLVVAAQ